MFGFLKSIKEKVTRAPERDSSTWGVDRSSHHTEAEQNLKDGNLVEAERNLTAALADAEQRKLPAGICITLRLDLAEVQRRLSHLREAEATLRQAAVVAVQSSDTKQFLDCLDALAEVFTAMENFPALEEVAREAIHLSAAVPKEDAWRKAVRVRRLALAQDKNGRFGDALATLDQAIASREKSLGPRHQETGDLVVEAGKLCRQHGEHGKAQEYLRRGLKIHEAACGDDSAQSIADLHELAGALADSGDKEGAAAQHERALMLKLRKLGVGNLDEVAEAQYNLAALYTGWGNLSRARELLADSIGAFQRTKGPRLAVAYETLAQVEERSGRVSFALSELGKAAQVWEKCGADRRRELAQNLEYQAGLHDQMRQRREANYLRRRAEDLRAECGDGKTEAHSA
jgi:tetratricopeptide (TPR) repeat protein